MPMNFKSLFTSFLINIKPASENIRTSHKQNVLLNLLKIEKYVFSPIRAR